MKLLFILILTVISVNARLLDNYNIIDVGEADPISTSSVIDPPDNTEPDCPTSFPRITTATSTEALYIPITLKICQNNSCQSICRSIGFRYGVCVTSSVCHCYN